MNYQVTIENQTFSVEIIDLHERPIRVLVDGECFEVWPEGQSQRPARLTSQPVKNVVAPGSFAPNPGPVPTSVNNGNPDQIKAPIPGVILSIAVHKGDQVQKGQELCVLEAMKMKNLIRSARDGMIAQVHVIPGQTVQHSELLMEYEPDQSASH